MRQAWPVTLWGRLKESTLQINPNIRLQAAAALLGGFYRGALTAVWQPFVLHLGGSVTFLGLLESLGGWGGIVPSVMQLLGGWSADRLGRRPVMLLASLAMASGMLLYTAAALLGLWPLLIPGVVLAGAGMLGRAANSSVTAESVREERRGLAYSVILFAFIAPGIVSSVAAGQVSERWGYLPIMLTALLFEALVLLAYLRFLRETRSHEGTPAGQRTPLGPLRLLTSRKMWSLILPIAGDSLFWGIAGSILYGILKDAHRFSDGQLGWVNAFFSLSWALSQLPVGRLIDRHGCKRFLVAAEVGLGGCLAIWLLWPTFPGVSIGYFLLGFTAALWVPALQKLIAGSVAEKERGEAMGLVFTLQSLSRFPGPYLASQLYTRWGYQAPLLTGLGGVILVVVSMVFLLQDPPANYPTAPAPQQEEG